MLNGPVVRAAQAVMSAPMVSGSPELWWQRTGQDQFAQPFVPGDGGVDAAGRAHRCPRSLVAGRLVGQLAGSGGSGQEEGDGRGAQAVPEQRMAGPVVRAPAQQLGREVRAHQVSFKGHAAVLSTWSRAAGLVPAGVAAGARRSAR